MIAIIYLSNLFTHFVILRQMKTICIITRCKFYQMHYCVAVILKNKIFLMHQFYWGVKDAIWKFRNGSRNISLSMASCITPNSTSNVYCWQRKSSETVAKCLPLISESRWPFLLLPPATTALFIVLVISSPFLITIFLT